MPDEEVPFDSSLASSTIELVPATLRISHNVSLTLADSLIVADDGSVLKNKRSPCCGMPLFIQGSKPTLPRIIPYYNILWAELADSDSNLSIVYADPKSKSVVRVESLNYRIDKDNKEHASVWITKLLNTAYGASQFRKRIKVLVNPFGGKGAAEKWFDRDIAPIFRAARCEVSVQRTERPGHATELIAENLDVNQWDVVACCSGDGVPHEVFNGLAKRADATRALQQIAVVQLPCGTGNAMSLNLNGTDSPSLAALAVVKGLRTPLDLVSITQGNPVRRTISFLSQAVGIIADCDLGTEHLRWMGDTRFVYGVLVHLLKRTVWPCDIAVGVVHNDKQTIKDAYRAESSKGLSSSLPESSQEGLPPLQFGDINSLLPATWKLVPYEKLGNFYAGNMFWMSANAPIFSAALPSDGCLDLVCIDGDLPFSQSIKSFDDVEKGTFFDADYVSYRKIAGYRIIPRGSDAGRSQSGSEGKTDGYISIDGERIPWEPFQAEVHRGLGTVLTRTGHLYQGRGPL